jgi:hypothetical protein
MRSSGISAHVFDLDNSYVGFDNAGVAALADATHLFVTCPPVADLDRDPLLALHRGESTSLQLVSFDPSPIFF